MALQLTACCTGRRASRPGAGELEGRYAARESSLHTMAQIRVAASADVNAPPQTVYAILADYQNEHPQILPDRHFSEFTVERGGKGAGTLIRFQMHVLGQSRTIRA